MKILALTISLFLGINCSAQLDSLVQLKFNSDGYENSLVNDYIYLKQVYFEEAVPVNKTESFKRIKKQREKYFADNESDFYKPFVVGRVFDHANADWKDSKFQISKGDKYVFSLYKKSGQKESFKKDTWITFSLEDLERKFLYTENDFENINLKAYHKTSSDRIIEVEEDGIIAGKRLDLNHYAIEITLGDFYVNAKIRIGQESIQVNNKRINIYPAYAEQEDYINLVKYQEIFAVDLFEDGVWAQLYKNGNIAKLFEVKNEKLHGSFIEFYKNDVAKVTAHYNYGMLDGNFTYKHENGKTATQLIFNNGELLNSKFEFFNKNGIVVEKGQFKNGYPAGKWSYFYNSGKTKAKGKFLTESEFYTTASKVGKWKYFYSSGELMAKGEHCKRFVRDHGPVPCLSDEFEFYSVSGKEIDINTFRRKMSSRMVLEMPQGFFQKLYSYTKFQ